MKFRTINKITAALITAVMVTSLWGCGTESTSDISVVDNETVLSNDNGIVGEDVVKKYPITDNGVAIWDFDEYVNSEWLTQAEESNEKLVYRDDEIEKLVLDRIEDILNDNSIYDLSSDDPLYKTKQLYDQLNETGFEDDFYESLKAFLEPVENIKTLDDLYEIYKQPEYAVFNEMIRFKVLSGSEENIILWYNPDFYNSLLKIYNKHLVEPGDPSIKYYADTMEKLGYTFDEAFDMLNNAVIIGNYAQEYMIDGSDDEYWWYYYRDYLADHNVTVPVFEILDATIDSEYVYSIHAYEAFCDYLNKVYIQDNIEALRDLLILNIVFDSSVMFEDWWDSDLFYGDLDFRLYFITQVSNDILSIEYQNRYFDEEKLSEIRQLVFKTKTAAQSIVKEMEWLSDKSMEIAVRKIVVMKSSFGVNDHAYDMSDVDMSDDAFTNFISILTSRRKFLYGQTSYFDDERGTYFKDTLCFNAYFDAGLNNIMLTTGLMTMLMEDDYSYEEKMATIGMTVAHEISHSFAPNSIYYDGDGYYYGWMTEDEMEEYNDRIRRIIQFFDGKETDYFEPLNASHYADETYADLMAMDICLRMLEEQENVDYDLFFRTYASRNAAYYTEEGVAIINGDNHLPSKFRINYILGQFPKFYEVYKIDDESPFYVPNLERLSIFK